MTPVSQSEIWYLDALKAHSKFTALITQTKAQAFDAGLLFFSARQSAAHGEWEKLVQQHEAEISLRTVQRYMKFANDCVAWAKLQNPRVADQRQLQSLARGMVLESALSFMELCREVGIVKNREANGARDGKRQQTYAQLNFNFDAFDSLLLAVEQHPDSNPFTNVDREELAAARARTARVVELMDTALAAEATTPRTGNNFLPESSGLTPSSVSEGDALPI